MFYFKRKNQGFTLIEMLVGVSLFLVIFGTLIGSLAIVFQMQRKALAKQSIQDNLRYALEFMGREIRMSQPAPDSSCIPEGTNFQQSSTSEIKFVNFQSHCVHYFLQDNEIKREIDAKTAPLTSFKLKIENLIFDLAGNDPSDNYQPRVTIIIKTSYKGQSFYVQTSIARRQLDI